MVSLGLQVFHPVYWTVYRDFKLFGEKGDALLDAGSETDWEVDEDRLVG